MKLKLYTSLFHVFSFFSDKTNGANPFVKYKLLLGTLIIGLVGTSAKAQKKETMSDTIPFGKPPHSVMASCYKVAVDSTKIPQTVKTKAPINIDSITSKPLKVDLSNELAGIMCYGIVNMPYDNDDIYALKYKEREFEYIQMTTKPISPVGSLGDFEKWVQSNIRYTEQMRKDGIKGEVKLSFVINKKGKLTDNKIVKGLSKEVDKEVLKVVSKSKKWKAGKLYENPEKTRVEITVKLNSSIE